jgi:hypothetical protein
MFCTVTRAGFPSITEIKARADGRPFTYDVRLAAAL